MDIKKNIEAARNSKFGLKKLNFYLGLFIPFNKPHGIKIHVLEKHKIETIIPYKRKNYNHIKGIHACALATTSEFASGFLLMSNLDFKKYRLIMQQIKMDYHYQAKSTCIATIKLSDDWFLTKVYEPIKVKDKISITNIVETYDSKNNHICTATIQWQIKAWKSVKTKV